MIETITQAHYERKREHGYAGPKGELYPETQTYWQATHWMLQLEAGIGTCLVPINVQQENPQEREHA